ncbi:MAG: hypothetical protein C0392_06470 [Syntrophus sp. (in: bacteria)]|nr:hypothetical protein [Syntrophus sp. (in: bacteria)]
MEKKEVPQDRGIYGKCTGICYAVDENGKYVLSPSAGWEPANIANQQAWELMEEQIAETRERVKRGELSPLAYYMARNLMDVKILAQYIGLPKWRVKRHLKPRVFRRLNPRLLERYAKLFNIKMEQLMEMH